MLHALCLRALASTSLRSPLSALRSTLYAASCTSSEPMPHALCPMPASVASRGGTSRLFLLITDYRGSAAADRANEVSPSLRSTLYALRCELRQQRDQAILVNTACTSSSSSMRSRSFSISTSCSSENSTGVVGILLRDDFSTSIPSSSRAFERDPNSV